MVRDRARIATLHVANVVATADWTRRRLRDSWWFGIKRPYAEAAMEQAIEWLLRPEIGQRFEDAGLREQDEGAAALLSHAEGIVAGLL